MRASRRRRRPSPHLISRLVPDTADDNAVRRGWAPRSCGDKGVVRGGQCPRGVWPKASCGLVADGPSSGEADARVLSARTSLYGTVRRSLKMREPPSGRLPKRLFQPIWMLLTPAPVRMSYSDEMPAFPPRDSQYVNRTCCLAREKATNEDHNLIFESLTLVGCHHRNVVQALEVVEILCPRD